VDGAAWNSFDDDIAAGAVSPAVGAAVPIELPPELQGHGTLWPTPAEQVSDHSAEGAPWQATARSIPQDPPMGPLPVADHDGAWVPFDAQVAVDSVNGNQIGAAASPNHQGTGAALAAPNGIPVIGQPFTVKTAETRTLATDQFDATGKRLNPPDAPSAPHELYGSQHYTRPRMTPYEVGALFGWAWPQGESFTNNPGYYGVEGYQPDMSARPQGAVVAQMPDDPYVAAAVPGPAPSAFVDYDLGI
jgi:hypothetical protein